jgi:hypothetical protein
VAAVVAVLLLPGLDILLSATVAAVQCERFTMRKISSIKSAKR